MLHVVYKKNKKPGKKSTKYRKLSKKLLASLKMSAHIKVSEFSIHHEK